MPGMAKPDATLWLGVRTLRPDVLAPPAKGVAAATAAALPPPAAVDDRRAAGCGSGCCTAPADAALDNRAVAADAEAAAPEWLPALCQARPLPEAAEQQAACSAPHIASNRLWYTSLPHC